MAATVVAEANRCDVKYPGMNLHYALAAYRQYSSTVRYISYNRFRTVFARPLEISLSLLCVVRSCDTTKPTKHN